MSLRCVVRSKFSKKKSFFLPVRNAGDVDRTADVEAELMEDELGNRASGGIGVGLGVDGCILVVLPPAAVKLRSATLGADLDGRAASLSLLGSECICGEADVFDIVRRGHVGDQIGSQP